MGDFYWLNEDSRTFLDRGYLLEDTSSEERVREIAEHAEDILDIDGFADKFYEYMSRGYYSLASPIWANFGLDRGAPISCFSSYIEDNMESILYTHAEVGMQTKIGGGTSGYFGDIRPRGSSITNNGKSNGTHPFAQLFDKVIDVVSQGECYTEGTEVLTDKGYKDFRDVDSENDKIAQLDEENNIEFTSDYELVDEKYQGEIHRYTGEKKTDAFTLEVTPGHRMVIERKTRSGWNGNTEIEYSEDLNLHRDNRVYLNGKASNAGKNFSSKDRLRIAFQADGRKDGKDRRIRFRFRKEYKIDRLTHILENLGWEYEISDRDSGTVEIATDYKENIKYNKFDEWVDLEKISFEWAEEFINELSYWDGSNPKDDPSLVRYNSTDKDNVDFVSAVCSLASKRTTISVNKDRPGNRQDLYRVNICGRKYRGGDAIKKEVIDYDGRVYCAVVPKGRLLVRKNGNTAVCGNTRRGHFAGYIDIEHDDIDEWLQIQNEGDSIQTMMYGVCIGDEWMQEMIDGDEEKRETWAKVIEQRMNLGIPYLFFRDNVNENKPQVYKDKGYKIHGSNLCLTGDQRVVTDRGYKRAEDLWEEGGELTLFDGEKAIDSTRMKLRQEKADVYKITLNNGIEQKVSSRHGMPVYQGRGDYERVEAQNVEIGDKIVVQKNKGLFGNRHHPDEAFLLGMWQSDGTKSEDTYMIDIWENDFDLEGEINDRMDRVYNVHGFNEYNINNQHKENVGTRIRETPQVRDAVAGHSNDDKKRIQSSKLDQLGFEKEEVPEWIFESDEETQWQYVRSLLIADGTVHVSESKGNPIQIAYADINREFLQQLQLIFNNLGLSSQIRLLREGGERPMPDGNGGQKLYETQDCYRLIVGNKNSALEIERNTGFLSRKGVNLEERSYRDNTKKAYEVVDIEHIGQETVYCPTTHTEESVFVSQGALTFNCSETILPSGPDESFVCCLSSMNALHFDEWKNTDAVETMTKFLDAVMEEFIDKAEGTEFLERSVRFTKRHRAIGIGILGWHSYLQSNRIPFESAEASITGSNIAKTIKERSYKASEEMAERFGPAPVMEGREDARRNTTTMAVAPTKSSSFILGQVSQSIEPIKSNYFVVDRAKIKTTYRNPHLKEVLQEKGKDTEEVWEKIALKDGSVQHLDFLSENEKNVFKTASEISQKAIVDQAAARQKHIDQGQSLNLFIDPKSVPVKDINQLYVQAWKKGVKTLYYQHGVNAAQDLSRNILDCEACEG